MVQTGVRPQEWNATVTSYGRNVSGIKKIKKIKLSKTTMTPFTSFNEYINEVNSSLSSFKSYVAKQQANMLQVGENKVTVDSQGANDLRG
ncbi:hypothetical protein NR996_01980 [Lactobacillus rodentium]|uniref:Uncharacterized protein n=1 Tax=Lactobacillus rodentium TaxID=947835 RepID=A0A2Z6T845_9LACO|nr:hypothetical protein [Lactobacillus rodentium]MCR1894181.1 hypothetical protein [Lactobacillus rodentium]GBG04478.1 hypothetical protein LrDSM24759_03920 [Lactobacillus rodentium]